MQIRSAFVSGPLAACCSFACRQRNAFASFSRNSTYLLNYLAGAAALKYRGARYFSDLRPPEFPLAPVRLASRLASPTGMAGRGWRQRRRSRSLPLDANGNRTETTKRAAATWRGCNGTKFTVNPRRSAFRAYSKLAWRRRQANCKISRSQSERVASARTCCVLLRAYAMICPCRSRRHYQATAINRCSCASRAGEAITRQAGSACQ